MRIGYACHNRSIRDMRQKSFRLSSLTREKLFDTIENNVTYLSRLVQWNRNHETGFLRISSDIIPFASHENCIWDWQKHIAPELKSIGKEIRQSGMRISMHPDQYVLINTPRENILENSIAELRYHAEILDLLELDTTAKIQIHVGGAYGNKPESIDRFVQRYMKLDEPIQRRLCIENDDSLFSLKDTMSIHEATGVPVILDMFHHELLNNGESPREALDLAAGMWSAEDGRPMVDYSSQQPGGPKGKHADSLDDEHFTAFVENAADRPIDVMLEIRDKENSTLRAMEIAREHGVLEQIAS